ncbi:MAG: hypothetical protein WD944_06520 [Steroidobacteraceae bacterium]
MAGKNCIKSVNPLIAVGDAPSTIEHCREVLSWMARVTDDAGGCDFGRALVLQTIDAALEHALMNIAKVSRARLEVANG